MEYLVITTECQMMQLITRDIVIDDFIANREWIFDSLIYLFMVNCFKAGMKNLASLGSAYNKWN